MKKIILLSLIAISTILPDSLDTKTDSIQTTQQTQVTQPQQTASKWYYGGTLGFSFWNDYFYLTVQPMVGYKVTPKLSLGAKIGYAYMSDDSYEPFPTLTTHNYVLAFLAVSGLFPSCMLMQNMFTQAMNRLLHSIYRTTLMKLREFGFHFYY